MGLKLMIYLLKINCNGLTWHLVLTGQTQNLAGVGCPTAFPAWEMIIEGRQQSGMIEVQKGQRSSYMTVMKGSVTTNLGGRLLRGFPILVLSLMVLAEIFISDIVRTFASCAKARKMWDLTRELGCYKAEEKVTEDRTKKTQVAFQRQKMCPMPCTSNTSITR